jgi:DNA-binding HxlR family transcriptional regulator
MANGGYNQFCPLAMAAEVLCTRWTLLVLRELIAGTTRFNDLRRGVPRMSPALLSKRLKELEEAGIVTRAKVAREQGVFEYRLTDAGRDLAPLVEAIGAWGHRWIETEMSLDNLDPDLLMWDVRRNINPRPMPRTRTVVQVIFADLPKARRDYWLIVQPGEDVDLCWSDPGFDVDLYLSTDLRTLTQVWMGYVSIMRAKQDGKLTITGDRQLAADMKTWFALSRFANVERRVA